MESIKKVKFIGLGTAAFVALLSLFTAMPALAASATMSLSSAGSVVKGAYITVSIRENSGAEPVNAAAATLSYPTDKLSYVSISSSSAFGVAAASSGGGGSVRVDRGALSPVAGNQLVASVTFKALTDSGTATINIASGSVYSASNNSQIYAGGSGTTISFKAPAPEAPKDTTPPQITAVTASEIGPTSAVISWTTSEPASSEVNYGVNQSYGLAAVDGNMVTAHKVTLNSALMEPGNTYHFIVKSVDPAGNATTGADQTFATTGATLLVNVKNPKNKPLKGAKVEIGGKSAQTDAKGQATVSGLKLGTHNGTVTYHNTVKAIKVEIKEVGKTPQIVNVTVKPAGSPLPWIALLILALAGATWILRAHPEFVPNRLARFHPANRTKSSPFNEKQSDPEVVKPGGPPKS